MGNRLLWTVWVIATLVVAGVAVTRLYVAGDRTAFLPGETSGVHHQIEMACETCHTSDAFASQKTVQKDINKTCGICHKEERADADDSHPIKKFKSPRMAEYWDKVDARFCTSCHSEHEPEVTLAGLLTLPGDYCVACHSEGDQDVRVNRVSHADLEFDTCATSGCHNFHDNRALYEDFLVKHGDAPWLAEKPMHQVAMIARAPGATDGADITTYLETLDAPDPHRDTEIEAHWAASAHAAGDVGCAGCHAPEAETEAQIEATWVATPGEEVCATCHKPEAKTVAMGRHGMRRHPDLAKPRAAKSALKNLGLKKPPDTLVAALETYLADAEPAPMMSTAEARVPLLPEAHGQDLTCNTCHAPHTVDLAFSAVEACTSCHADTHTQSYKDSPHFALWTAELAGNADPGTGVSCATCHMPQSKRKGVVTTNHNQNDSLRPNEKMIRPVCMDCHSLEFSIDALADADLVERNFSGKPDRHIESIDWALRRVDQPEQGDNQ